MVYVGSYGTPWRGNTWYHLSADTLEELHTFAKDKLNLKREWFQNHQFVPHYDVTESKRKKAIAAGAIVLTRDQEAERIQLARDQKLCWLCHTSKPDTTITVECVTPGGDHCPPKDVRVHMSCYQEIED